MNTFRWACLFAFVLCVSALCYCLLQATSALQDRNGEAVLNRQVGRYQFIHGSTKFKLLNGLYEENTIFVLDSKWGRVWFYNVSDIPGHEANAFQELDTLQIMAAH